MTPSAFIFDMDGLMVDTEPLARRAWDAVVAPYGVVISDDLYGRMMGRRTTETARIVLSDLPLPLTGAELLDLKTVGYLAILDAGGVPAMLGLMGLLAALDAAAVPWAVATSTPRAITDHILDHLGLSDRYAALATGDEVEYGKPAPDIFLLAAKRLGVDPARCVALEDSPAGCQSAAAAGMRVLAVPTPFTAAHTFDCATAHYASLVEVTADLERWLN
jgi:HAD superfamily hydrolase (TIGR01509 family)